jgi:hypothetical protein
VVFLNRHKFQMISGMANCRKTTRDCDFSPLLAAAFLLIS